VGGVTVAEGDALGVSLAVGVGVGEAVGSPPQADSETSKRAASMTGSAHPLRRGHPCDRRPCPYRFILGEYTRAGLCHVVTTDRW